MKYKIRETDNWKENMYFVKKNNKQYSGETTDFSNLI